MVHCSNEQSFFFSHAQLANMPWSLKAIQSFIVIVTSLRKLQTPFLRIYLLPNEDRGIKENFFVNMHKCRHCFAPIVSMLVSPVTSGVETHHILFSLCQRGRTIAAHLVPVFFSRVHSCWMIDEAVSSRFLWCLGSGLSLSSVWLFWVDTALISWASVTLRWKTACWYRLNAEVDSQAQVHRERGEVTLLA